MAITINLTNITVDPVAGTMVVVDGTTYTSPVRTALAVYMKIYKVDYSAARTYVTTTGNNTDPASASLNQWSASYTADGWYKLAYVAIPFYAGGTTYAKYDAAYDSTNKLVYRSKSAGNIGNALTNTTFWELITDPAALAFNIGSTSESVNLTTITSQAVYNIVLKGYLDQYFLSKTEDSMVEASSDYRRPQDVRLAEFLLLGVFGIDVANNRQNYILGEQISRRCAYLIANGN